MESEQKFISLSYDLFIRDEEGNLSIFERASKEKPFQFYTGIGYTLDIFEDNVSKLKISDTFEFSIPADKAYGEYSNENVLELPKSVFEHEGVFDSKNVREGCIIPLSDGQNTYNALVSEIKDDMVVVDLNHPLAGEELTFKGIILESRPATKEEIDQATNIMNNQTNGCSTCGGSDECNGNTEDYGCNGCCS